MEIYWGRGFSLLPCCEVWDCLAAESKLSIVIIGVLFPLAGTTFATTGLPALVPVATWDFIKLVPPELLTVK